jgi:hypothetical protein
MVTVLSLLLLPSCRCEQRQPTETEAAPEEWDIIDRGYAPVVQDTVGVPEGPDEGSVFYEPEKMSKRKLANRKKTRARKK